MAGLLQAVQTRLANAATRTDFSSAGIPACWSNAWQTTFSDVVVIESRTLPLTYVRRWTQVGIFLSTLDDSVRQLL